MGMFISCYIILSSLLAGMCWLSNSLSIGFAKLKLKTTWKSCDRKQHHLLPVQNIEKRKMTVKQDKCSHQPFSLVWKPLYADILYDRVYSRIYTISMLCLAFSFMYTFYSVDLFRKPPNLSEDADLWVGSILTYVIDIHPLWGCTHCHCWTINACERL